MRLRSVLVLITTTVLLVAVGLAAAASAGATTIDFEATPPTDGTTITKQYDDVDSPYGGVEFVSGIDKSQTPFEAPTVQNVGNAAHSGSRVLGFTGSANGEPGQPSDLQMTFDTARQTVSFYLEQATTISTDTSFAATGYDGDGDQVAQTTIQIANTKAANTWNLFTLTAPGSDMGGWISTLKLTGGSASVADTYYVDDLSFTDPSSPPPPPPTADFTCSPGCDADAGATITFQSTTNATKPNYSWDLDGDGTIGDSTDVDPTHVYTKAGAYTVTLQVIDGADGESKTVEHTVTIFAPPVVDTGAASGVSSTGAVLNGTVDPRGGPVTDCHFDWGTTTNYGHSVPCSTSPGDGSGAVAVSAAIGSLSTGMTYHYRLDASHGFGQVNGNDGSFTTLGSAPGFTAKLSVANTGPIHAGDVTQLHANSTPPPGYEIYEYRWSFNDNGRWDTDTGDYNVASHIYTTGQHAAEVEVLAHDSTGQSVSTTTTVHMGALVDTAGCSSDLTQGFLNFAAQCIKNDNGKYTITIGQGVQLDGLLLTSPDAGAKLTLDTTGSNSNSDNPTHQWALRSTGPIDFSIENAPDGTLELFQVDWSHTPLLLPVGADTPDQNAPGLRLLTLAAGHDCSSHLSGFPPVVCAQLPGNFPLTGSISVYVTGGVHGENPGVAIQANISIAPPVNITANVTFTGDNTDGINLDSWGIQLPGFNIGSIVTVDPTMASYQREDDSGGRHDQDVYELTAGIHLHVASSAGIRIHVRFANGRFSEADFTLSGHFVLGPVVLTQLEGHLGINPFSIGVGVQGSVGPLGLSAGVLYQDAYHGNPWFLQIGTLTPGHDPNGVDPLYVQYPAINPVLKIAGALYLYGDGFVSGQVNVDFALPNVDASNPTVLISGFVGGFFKPAGSDPGPSYQISGGVHASVHFGVVSADGELEGYVNQYYLDGTRYATAAGCGNVEGHFLFLSAGIGAWAAVDLTHDNHVYDAVVWSGDPCSVIGQWCVPASVTAGHTAPACLDDSTEAVDETTRAAARAARAAGTHGTSPQHLWIPSGMHTENLLLTSLTGVPQVTITGPSGTYTTSTSTQPAGQAPTFLSGTIPGQHQLNLVLINPKPGAYTVTPVAGSPAIEPVLESHPLPAANIHVRVVRSGSRRVLHYSLRAEPGQKVEFLERSADADTPIGKPTARSHGSIAFTPQTNATHLRRQIVAQLFENGLVEPAHIVGGYTAPAPPKLRVPRKVTVKRRHNVATITWSAVADATGYQVWVIGSDGRRVMYDLPAKRRTLRIAPVFPNVSLRLSVAALGGPRDEPGPARKGTLRRAKG
jgi:PKD repeat protein